MATESEIKTSAERFLARAKEFAWLGAAAAALVTAIWWATTYLNDKRLEYVKTFNEKQITLSFDTAETVAKLLTAETKEEWDTHVAKFRALYWGQLVLVESKKVAEGAELRDLQPKPKPVVIASWRAELGNFNC